MPTLYELNALFDEMPEVPPPLPRQRRHPPAQATPEHEPVKSAAPPLVQEPSLFRRVFPWAFSPLQTPSPARKPNPFAALKAGKRIVVIAVVDSGSISFFRFGQGAFAEWPMV